MIKSFVMQNIQNIKCRFDLGAGSFSRRGCRWGHPSRYFNPATRSQGAQTLLPGSSNSAQDANEFVEYRQPVRCMVFSIISWSIVCTSSFIGPAQGIYLVFVCYSECPTTVCREVLACPGPRPWWCDPLGGWWELCFFTSFISYFPSKVNQHSFPMIARFCCCNIRLLIFFFLLGVLNITEFLAATQTIISAGNNTHSVQVDIILSLTNSLYN